jgi:uncharacterized delta-60 repeat protein
MPRHLTSCLALAGAALFLPLRATQAQLPGTVDLSFDPGTVLLNPEGNFSNITAVAVQPDGKILVATDPEQYSQGIQVVKTRQEAKATPQSTIGSGSTLPTLARFNADGSVDASFNVTIDNGYDIEAIAVESNGEIVIGGDFFSVNGNSCNYVAVVKTDGTFDTAFNSGGSGPQNSVTSIVVQTDGKIVLGGYFNTYNSTSVSGIIRVNGNGTVDTGFQNALISGSYVYSLALQSDGKIVAAGDFQQSSPNDSLHPLVSSVNPSLVRLNADGTLDSAFTGDSAISSADQLTVQPNDQIILTAYDSIGQGYGVFRLNPDGSVDPSFTFTADNAEASAVAAQPDGKILVGGQFYFVNGVPQAHIARLNADGTLDTTFNVGVGANGSVQQIALRPDGEIFVAGAFNGISDASRSQLALLYGVALPGTLQFSGSSYHVNEDGGSVQIMVERTGGDTGAISVSYATADGTALAGTDYTATSGTLTWADGDLTPKSFTVPILNPSVYGGSKSFSISLGSPTAGVTLGVALAEVLILDSDLAPQPVVTLTSPPTDITVITGSTVPLSASVSDPGSILSSVQFTVNGASVATITGTGPYVSSITAGAPGTYTIAAVATDTQGRISTSSHVLTVLAVDSNNPAPLITLLTDLNDRKFGQGAIVPISISAVSGDGTPLVSVTFYANGVPFATINGSTPSAHPVNGPIRKASSSPAPASGIFQANYQMPANTNRVINLLAVALSKLGVSQSTPVASVEGVSPSVDQAPLVALTNISNSTQVQVGQTLDIPVTASDPNGGAVSNVISPGGRRTKDLTPSSGQIARMEYFVNQLKVLDSAQQPFGFNFTPSAAGQYIVDAIATDGAGVSTVSTPVTVTAIAPPVVSLSAVGNSEAIAGVKNGKVLFTRTGGDMTLNLNVNYKVGGGTVNGTDFQLLSGTLLIPAGQTSVKLKIVPIVESPQPDRKVNIKLLPATDGSYTLGSDIKVKLQLIDND